MMKRFTLLIFSCLLFCGIGNAQETTFSMEPLNVERDIEVVPGESQDFEIHNQFINQANKQKTYVWERTVLHLPQDWKTAICDKNACYQPNLSSYSFEIDPTDTFDMIVHAYNYGNTGDSVIVQLRVYEEGNEENSLTSTYSMYNDAATAVDDADEFDENLRLYPNPTTHGFQLTGSNNINELIVYNIVGKQVKQFDAHRDRVYDVGDLQKGMYFVRLLSEDGKVEKTLRLNKE